MGCSRDSGGGLGSSHHGSEVTKTFASFAIRIVTIDGNPWFVAADVCRALGICHAYKAVAPLSPDERNHHQMMNGGRPAAIISESGLYKVIMRSDKPNARQFQDWVTRDVLPAIRKDGGYILGEEKVATGEMSEAALLLGRTSWCSAPVEYPIGS